MTRNTNYSDEIEQLNRDARADFEAEYATWEECGGCGYRIDPDADTCLCKDPDWIETCAGLYRIFLPLRDKQGKAA